MTYSGLTTKHALPARLLATFVVAAIVIALAASVVGLHAHVLPDGRIVVHWHPVDKAERGKTHHQHSGHDYTVLANLGHLSTAHPPGTAGSPIHAVACVHRIDIVDDTPGSQTASYSPNKRSPPVATPL